MDSNDKNRTSEADDLAVQARIDDVLNGIRSYASLSALVTEGHPFKTMAMAEYMATLMHKLIEWGVLTREQMDQVHNQIKVETYERVSSKLGQMINGLNDDEDDGDAVTNEAALRHILTRRGI